MFKLVEIADGWRHNSHSYQKRHIQVPERRYAIDHGRSWYRFGSIPESVDGKTAAMERWCEANLHTVLWVPRGEEGFPLQVSAESIILNIQLYLCLCFLERTCLKWNQ